MDHNYLILPKQLFLLILLAFLVYACNYKGAGFFAPTNSIPGEEPILSAPVLVYPGNGSSNINPNVTFEWQNIPGALTYEFQLREETGEYGDENSISESGISGNTYTAENLNYGLQYKWRVRGVAGDLISPYSLEYNFSTSQEPFATYILQIETDGNGTVTSSDNGINCGNDCSEEYEEGTEITLTAEGSEGWVFEKWTGTIPESCIAENPSCTFTINSKKELTAHFIEGSHAPSISKVTGNWGMIYYTFTTNTCDDQSGEFSVSAEILLLDEQSNEIGIQFPDAPDLIRGLYNTQSGPDAGWFTGMTGMVDIGGYYAQEFWDGQFYLIDGVLYYTGVSLVEYSTGMNSEDVFCMVEYDVIAEKDE